MSVFYRLDFSGTNKCYANKKQLYIITQRITPHRFKNCSACENGEYKYSARSLRLFFTASRQNDKIRKRFRKYSPYSSYVITKNTRKKKNKNYRLNASTRQRFLPETSPPRCRWSEHNNSDRKAVRRRVGGRVGGRNGNWYISSGCRNLFSYK